MSNNFSRKQVGQKILNLKKIVDQPVYWVTNEDFILVKNSVEKVILDNQVTNEIIIKALSPVVVTCSKNKIDEEYDEIFLDKGSCVQLLKLNNIWYIVSSDGLKLN